MVSAAQLSGYLLEEVVTHLLQRSGYRLLSVADDQDALVSKGNGLRVRGRGAEHQADALGRLDVAVPFSFPIRLFVEAKNTNDKVGLDVVRNAHGIVHDVNEFVVVPLASATKARHLRRVQYRYAVFSTSGFTHDAQNFAFTHQISLIDLSGPGWAGLAERLRVAAKRFLDEVEAQPVPPKPQSSTFVARSLLRDALAVAEPASRHASARARSSRSWQDEWARDVASTVVHSESSESDILLGFVDAPFILALQPDDTEAFTRYATGRDSIEVDIVYDRRGESGEWVVYARDEPERSRLTFPLPGILEPIVLADVERNVHSVARDLLSDITVYVDNAPVRLRYRRSNRPATGEIAEDGGSWTGLRRDRVATVRAWARDVQPVGRPAALPAGRWGPLAIQELLGRLRDGGYPQEKLIRYAARHDGAIDRERIYEIAGFAPDRTLRGLATPTNRIRRELIAEGQLAPDAPLAFRAEYPTGVTAAHYEVPEEFIDEFRSPGTR